MRLKQNTTANVVIISVGTIFFINIIIPLFLNLVEFNLKITIISILGSLLIISMIGLTIVDLSYLLLKKKNYILLSSLNMSLAISSFLLLEYCFLSNVFDIFYVWSYSSKSLPIIYKLVAIWAGESGSIMTWMVFNSIAIFFFRIKSQDKDDIVFIRSVIISLIISTVFLVLLFFLNPFKLETSILFPAYPNGRGLNPLLISPFMIWHPFFTFISYATFLIPFTVVISEALTRNSKLLNSYQQKFFDFSLKFGWLVLSLSIGLGAYWAKIALTPWGRYWGWDPVEIVSLVPWFFVSAYFHNKIFQKKNPLLVKINVVLIFLSIIFSTLIVRGGGLSSLHAFTGATELVVWVVILGLILIIGSLYIIYIMLDYLFEEYRSPKLFFDYLSYIFLICLAFVCIFGLFIPPFTHFLSNYFAITVIFIRTDYYILSTLVLATGLAISLIFCSLWEYFSIKWISIAIIIALLFQSVVSYSLLFIFDIGIHPLIIIFLFAIFASLFKLSKNFNVKKGVKYFFRLNSKTIIHAGISFILVGFLIPSNFEIFQDIFFISGFILLMIGIVPSILISLLPSKSRLPKDEVVGNQKLKEMER